MEHAKHDWAGNVLLFNVTEAADTVPYDTSVLIHRKIEKFYNVVDGEIVSKPQAEVDAIIEAEAEAAGNEVARIADIEQAQESEGLKQYTLGQADAFLQNKLDLTELDAATDLATAKAALKKLMIAIYQIHMKEMPYILRPLK